MDVQRQLLRLLPVGPQLNELYLSTIASRADRALFERVLYSALSAAAAAKKASKDVQLSAASLRAHAALLVVTTVNAPTFTSQTKERCDGWARVPVIQFRCTFDDCADDLAHLMSVAHIFQPM